MSSISTISNTANSYVAPIAVDSQSAAAGSFSQTLAVAQAPRSWLTSAETSQTSRPSLKEFMDRSGAEFLDASELIYGVVGSNTDVRDWSAIMASEDPITAARQATAQMYGRTDTPARTDASYVGSSDTLAREGNYAVRLLKDKDQKLVDEGLKLIDAQGLILRDAGSDPQSIARNAWLFGFDTKPLAKLSNAAGMVSETLRQAVAQASVMAPAPYTAMASISAANIGQESAPVAGAQKAELSAMDAPVQAPNSVSTAQSDFVDLVQEQATAPALEHGIEEQITATESTLARAIDEATSSSLGYVDSTSYLNALFRS